MTSKNAKLTPTKVKVRLASGRTIQAVLTALTEIPQFCSPKFPTPGRFRS